MTAAADWPTARHDVSRSGATDESLTLPLQPSWIRTPPAPPTTAWAGPDNRTIEGHALRDRANYDAAFGSIVVGDRMYYGSSVDHHIYCLNLQTGQPIWKFATNAAVRLAPTVVGERLLCGSDDGFVYCLNRQTGDLLWKLRGGPRDEWLLGRGEMMSRWPIRTSILVQDGIAYFGAGVFPHEDIYLYAVSVAEGRILWKQDDISESDAARNSLSPQGHLLANRKYLLVPSGRALPTAFDLKSGEPLRSGRVEWAKVSWRSEGVVGGTRAVLADDKIYSLGEETILGLDPATGRGKSWFPNGKRMAVAGEFAYVLTGTQLVKVHRAQHAQALIDRSRLEAALKTLVAKLRKPKENVEAIKAEIKTLQAELAKAMQSGTEWSVPATAETAVIVAGEHVITGGNGRVDIFAARDGSRLWNTTVAGDVHDLVVANGHLLASSSAGPIYAFAPQKPKATNSTPSANSPQFQRSIATAAWQDAAQTIIKQLGTDKGYALLIGAGDGQLAWELAKASQLKIHLVEPDAEAARTVREKLFHAGLYGHRVTVLNTDYATIPYSNYFANLVISPTQLTTEKFPCPAAQITRFVKPIGGKLFLGKTSADEFKTWLSETKLVEQSTIEENAQLTVLTRGKLPGAADWSHQYGGPGNTASTTDQRIKQGLGVLWFGDPGPGKMVNRHEGAVGPLSVNGRLIIQGQSAVMAYDAYNGQFLWQHENPKAVRTGVFKNYNPGNLVASEDSVFIMIRDKVLQLDAATGELTAEHLLPENKRAEHEWGYVAVQDGLLFGTATIRKEIAERNRRRGRATEDATDGIFAIDLKTGKVAWTYQGKSIAHHTIAIGPGRVYFIDSTITSEQRADLLRQDKSELKDLSPADAKIAEDRMKRIDARTAVAVNARTGKLEWSTPVDVTDCSNIGIGGGQLTLMYQNNVLVLCGANANGHYWRQFIAGDFSRRRLLCLSAEDGHKLWSKDANYRHRPIIIGDQIIAEPWGFDLYTGEQRMRLHPLTGNEVPWSIIRPGHHCGMLTGSANMLMFRSGYTGFYDLNADDGTRHFAGHRLGCWINAIPAGGLVMIPEASAGCVCQFSIASTIVLEPRAARRPWTIISSVGKTTPVKRMALNFGAPGDRADARGNIWLAYPRPNPKKTTGLDLPLNIQPVFATAGGYDTVNENSLKIPGAETAWLLTSWARGLQKCSLPLLGKDDAPAKYTVRLHFADVPGHQPTFGIRLQGQQVEDGLTLPDSHRAVVKEYTGIEVTKDLALELTLDKDAPKSTELPILNALEILREE